MMAAMDSDMTKYLHSICMERVQHWTCWLWVTSQYLFWPHCINDSNISHIPSAQLSLLTNGSCTSHLLLSLCLCTNKSTYLHQKLPKFQVCPSSVLDGMDCLSLHLASKLLINTIPWWYSTVTPSLCIKTITSVQYCLHHLLLGMTESMLDCGSHYTSGSEMKFIYFFSVTNFFLSSCFIFVFFIPV